MIAVIGCGNLNRSDDGVGIDVVRRLGASNVFQDDEEVRIYDAGTDGMAVMFAARGCDSLILIDGCQSGAAPGAIFEAPGEELETPAHTAPGLHGFRWDHALFAGRQMYGTSFPRSVTVFLIEAASTDFGIGLSDEVRAAAVTVAARITDSVRARRAAALH